MGSYAQMKQGARGFWNGALGPRGQQPLGALGGAQEEGVAQQSLWVLWLVHVKERQ